MKRILIALLLLTCFIPIIQAKKLAILNDYFKYPFVIIDQKQIYVWDRILRKIYIYSRTDFSKIKEFGEKGMGPGEFNGINSVRVADDYIYVNSFPKIIFFTKSGDYIKEIRHRGGTSGGFFALRNRYVGIHYPPTKYTDDMDKMVFSFYDNDLQKENEIYCAVFRKFRKYSKPKEIQYLFNDCTKADVYKNRLYIGSTAKGFYFVVFDDSGNKLYEINKEYERRKVTELEKKRTLREFKEGMPESEWVQYKAHFEIVCRDYYPAYEYFCVVNDHIYVFEYSRLNNIDINILKLSGDLVAKKSIPKDKYGIGNGRFALSNNKLYYVIENQQEEAWELNCIDIK